MGRLDGKTAVITGAGRGIGRASAVAFADEGADVWAVDLDGAALGDLDGIATRVVDVTDGAAIDGLATEVGPADVLVNCAGIVAGGSVLDCTDDEWDRTMDVNAKSMLRTIRAFLPGMLAAGGGSIVNVSSVASSITGVPARFAYSASKAAVIGLTKSVAADYVGDGIRCNAVCPGTVATPSWEERVAAAPDPVQARRDFIARQPMGRVGTAEEIAALVVYLASDDSAYTTGAVHVIDGGMAM